MAAPATHSSGASTEPIYQQRRVCSIDPGAVQPVQTGAMVALPRMRQRTGAAGVAAAKARNLDAAVFAAMQLVEKGSQQAGAVAPDEMAPGVQACSCVQDFWIRGDRHVGKEGRA